MTTTGQIRDFYDNFSLDNLVQDFHNYNLRQEAVKELCERFIQPGSRILEIGCGVAILSKFLQKKSKFLLAVDISEVNVRIAKLYAGTSNTEFRVLDITEQSEVLATLGLFDVIVLADVFEHIPLERRRQVFLVLEGLLSPDGSIILTYPSPGYQVFLKDNLPNQLQVVDEIVELRSLLSLTSLNLFFYQFKNVWGANQYIHVVLRKHIQFSETQPRSILIYFTYRLKKYFWRFRHIFFLRKVSRVLKKEH